jgi:hypothetical protein
MQLSERELYALLSAAIMLAGTGWYAYLVWTNKVETVIASWILGFSTLSISYATYWTSPKHSLYGNIANASAIIGAAFVLCILFFRTYKGRKIEFNLFQKKCLKLSGWLLAAWLTILAFGGTGTVPNLLAQALMLLSYAMLYQKLWHASENKESFGLWGGICVSSLVGLKPALESGEWQSVLYCTLASLRSAAVVVLMCRLVLRKKLQAAAV